MGRLVKMVGESRLVQLGFATMAVSFALLAGVHGIPLLLAAIGLLTFGSAVLRPSLTSLITMRAARHQQGMVIGLMQSLMAIAQIIAPVIAGFLIQGQLLAVWALAGSVFCATGWAFIMLMR
jgi:MFS family permease